MMSQRLMLTRRRVEEVDSGVAQREVEVGD